MKANKPWPFLRMEKLTWCLAKTAGLKFEQRRTLVSYFANSKYFFEDCKLFQTIYCKCRLAQN